MAFYVARIIFFCFTHVVDVIALVSVLSCVLLLLWFLCVCLIWIWGRESVRIFLGKWSWGVWCCLFVVLCVCCIPLGLVWRECMLFCLCWRYNLMFAFAMFMSLCVDVVCIWRESYWWLRCWSVRCVYVEKCGWYDAAL